MKRPPYPSVDPNEYTYVITLEVHNGEVEQVMWYSDTALLWVDDGICPCCDLEKRRPVVGPKAWRRIELDKQNEV